MNYLPPLLLILLLAGCSAPQPSAPSTYDLILLNAHIIDVANGDVSDLSLVGISGDTVRIVTDMSNAASLDATRIVDLEGQFIMPGLWDNHVHFRGGDSLRTENKNLLPLFLAHGITTVRDAGGDITPEVLQWQRDIRAGYLAGPDIFTSGPKFDGPEPVWEGSVTVSSPEDVMTAMDSLEKLGVDYIKIYNGSLTADMYYEIIREAERRGLPVTGHMPMDASLLDGIRYGLDGTEHLEYALNAASPWGDSLRSTGLGFGMMGALVDSYDESYAMEIFEEMARADFYVTPTLFIGRVLQTIPFTDHSTDTLLRYMGPGIRNTYARRVNSANRRSIEDQKLFENIEATCARMVKPMEEAGIHILAGSDCGAYNSYVYPGASLIGELEALVSFGKLTPREALTASVINGPAFFDLSDFYGSVESGKVADIIVLRENPLENIEAIRKLTLVINGANIIAAGRLLK